MYSGERSVPLGALVGSKVPLLSPRNSVGGDIVMWPFVCGWVSPYVCPCVCPCVCPSRSALWAQYKLQILPHHFQTSHVSCSWWEEEPYWFLVTESKVKVKFGTLSIKPCGHKYRQQYLPNHFQTSHASCGWWEEEPYWFLVTGSKGNVNFAPPPPPPALRGDATLCVV